MRANEMVLALLAQQDGLITDAQARGTGSRNGRCAGGCATSGWARVAPGVLLAGWTPVDRPGAGARRRAVGGRPRRAVRARGGVVARDAPGCSGPRRGHGAAAVRAARSRRGAGAAARPGSPRRRRRRRHRVSPPSRSPRWRRPPRCRMARRSSTGRCSGTSAFAAVYQAYCRNLGAYRGAQIAELLIAAADRADSAAERVVIGLLRARGSPAGRWGAVRAVDDRRGLHRGQGGRGGGRLGVARGRRPVPVRPAQGQRARPSRVDGAPVHVARPGQPARVRGGRDPCGRWHDHRFGAHPAISWPLLHPTGDHAGGAGGLGWVRRGRPARPSPR